MENNTESKGLGCVFETDELRKMIIEHPELPIMVLAGEDSWNGEHGYTCCSKVYCTIEEVPDYDLLDGNDCIFTDREEFADFMDDKCCEELDEDMDENEYEKRLGYRIHNYDKYWKKVITITVDN